MADKEKKTTITIQVKPEFRALVEEWSGLLGFGGLRETVEHMTMVGMMCHEMVAGKPLTGEGFANALYTIGRAYLDAEFGRQNVQDTIRNFREWQKQKSELTSQSSKLKRM